MTYEKLTKKTDVDETSPDHVYLGLDIHSDNQPAVTNKYENVSQADISVKPPKITEKAEDRVYNTLDANTLNTHTENMYTGLKGRENGNAENLGDVQDDSGTSNRSSDAHYFILHNETDDIRNRERTEEELGASEDSANGDNRTKIENDYFILEKAEHSDSKFPEFKQNDEISVDESEAAYHILEKE